MLEKNTVHAHLERPILLTFIHVLQILSETVDENEQMYKQALKHSS